jgi:hypothetical protein
MMFGPRHFHCQRTDENFSALMKAEIGNKGNFMLTGVQVTRTYYSNSQLLDVSENI